MFVKFFQIVILKIFKNLKFSIKFSKISPNFNKFFKSQWLTLVKIQYTLTVF